MAADAGCGDSTYQGYDDRITAGAEEWLRVSGADRVTLILATGSSFNGFDKSPTKQGADQSAQATKALESRRHVRDHAGALDARAREAAHGAGSALRAINVEAS